MINIDILLKNQKQEEVLKWTKIYYKMPSNYKNKISLNEFLKLKLPKSFFSNSKIKKKRFILKQTKFKI